MDGKVYERQNREINIKKYGRRDRRTLLLGCKIENNYNMDVPSYITCSGKVGIFYEF